MNGGQEKDLYVLVADKDMKFAVEELLSSRHHSLGIRMLANENFTVTAFTPEHDAGCYLHAQEFLRPFINRYQFAMVIFDLEFDKKREFSRDMLEDEVERRLAQNGWENRSAAVVINPELESWIFSDSPHVDEILGWKNKSPSLQSWLQSAGYLRAGQIKPDRPKEAMRDALASAGKKPSGIVFKKIAEKVSLSQCQDPSFQKFTTVLRQWFPP